MAFMSFTVFSQKRSTMLIIESMLAGHDIPGTMALGDTIHGNNDVEEHSAGEYDTDDHSCWNPFERKCVDLCSNALLGCLNRSFNHFGMFIFCGSVEGNLGFEGLVTERGKLSICIDLSDDKTALPVGSTYGEETCQERLSFVIGLFLMVPLSISLRSPWRLSPARSWNFCASFARVISHFENFASFLATVEIPARVIAWLTIDISL